MARLSKRARYARVDARSYDFSTRVLIPYFIRSKILLQQIMTTEYWVRDKGIHFHCNTLEHF